MWATFRSCATHFHIGKRNSEGQATSKQRECKTFHRGKKVYTFMVGDFVQQLEVFQFGDKTSKNIPQSTPNRL